MGNSSLTWSAYCAVMAQRIVALDKRPGLRPIKIGETLRRALAKLVMRAAGDKGKMECVKLQLCAGLKARKEGATQAMGQLGLERVIRRRSEEEA